MCSSVRLAKADLGRVDRLIAVRYLVDDTSATAAFSSAASISVSLPQALACQSMLRQAGCTLLDHGDGPIHCLSLTLREFVERGGRFG